MQSFFSLLAGFAVTAGGLWGIVSIPRDIGEPAQLRLDALASILAARQEQIHIFPSSTVAQGQTLRIVIENPRSQDVIARFRGKEYEFFEYRDALTALIPLDVGAKAGVYDLVIGAVRQNSPQAETIPVTVVSGNFRVSEVPPPRPLTSTELAQRTQERSAIVAAYEEVVKEIYFDKPFGNPLLVRPDSPQAEMIVTSPFGAKRVSNATGQLLSVHNGTDFRASVGTPVLAVNDGVVDLAETYLFEGGFVIIDHGFGINSVYLHLSEVKVKTGARVARGEVIGLSGGSGRSLGPHLHFTVKLNEIAVDPLQFLGLWQ